MKLAEGSLPMFQRLLKQVLDNPCISLKFTGGKYETLLRR